MYWPCMNKHWPFQMVMSKIICAEWEFKGLTGSATFENKGTCWKTFIGISCVSFVMFLLLRLLILTWISESELGHIIQHNYSAQIFFDMHEFNALRYHYVFGIKWKTENMLLIMKHAVCFNLAWQWRYLTDKTGFLSSYWDALYNSELMRELHIFVDELYAPCNVHGPVSYAHNMCYSRIFY